MSNIGVTVQQTYHPDRAINLAVSEERISAEIADLAAGFPPSAWTCGCGATHSRGWHMTPGVHRCLACGYEGRGGVLAPVAEGIN